MNKNYIKKYIYMNNLINIFFIFVNKINWEIKTPKNIYLF